MHKLGVLARAAALALRLACTSAQAQSVADELRPHKI
jgi:hypothetical protein